MEVVEDLSNFLHRNLRKWVSQMTGSPYAFLTQPGFDTIFVIDDSGSMAGRCWRETKDRTCGDHSNMYCSRRGWH